jgi:hypothetical protein
MNLKTTNAISYPSEDDRKAALGRKKRGLVLPAYIILKLIIIYYFGEIAKQ